uniref:Ctd-like (NLI interacting factor-like) phosphatase n=1 Tax=Pithovirus LCPAC104 TaxID=2506589 RepID=A0A481Z544_9VIRU|nr:MAG: ctd-like (NLI interacting factor-like) phosphatase [Pithovirus LCPAC104]
MNDLIKINNTRNTITDKCIVLDLDETLVYSNTDFSILNNLKIFKDKSLNDIKSRSYILRLEDAITPKGYGEISNLWGIKRPHIKNFLNFCFRYFKVVAIWSAGKKEYVDQLVKNIFIEIIGYPHIIFSWNEIKHIKDGSFTKTLQKMIDSVPGLEKYMNLENTLIIDDLLQNFTENKDNGILIPSYSPSMNIKSLREDDISLQQFISWLLKEDVKNSKDVRLLKKDEIFKIDKAKLEEIKDSDVQESFIKIVPFEKNFKNRILRPNNNNIKV